MEEETKMTIDKICQKNNIPITRNIPTSEQYEDLVQATKGRFTETYYNFLIEKYGKKWVMNNAFASPEEMVAFEKSINYNPEVENEDNKKPAIKKNISTKLGESTKYSHDGLSHIFLLYAKGIIQELNPEQFSLMYLELYGKLLSPETCTELVAQINQSKKEQVNMLFSERMMEDSILVSNGIRYIKAKASKEKWSQERYIAECNAFRITAKDLEKEIGVTLGRGWVHEIAKESKDSALKKTFNFVLKKLDTVISGTVRDVADIDSVSTRKIKIGKN